jgi:peptide/nickel transport system substrate-binding protein
MRRRHLLLAGATAATISLSRPVRAAAPADRTLRYVPPFGPTSLDPILGIPTSDHSYMVYDTLYGVDLAFVPQPQIAAGHVVEDEGRRWTITLREGLIFHDGEKVRARDAVVSIGRWMKRNTFGQKLESVTDELSAQNDRNIVFRLKKPFPLLLAALANPANPAFVLPERVAQTDPYKPIQDATVRLCKKARSIGMQAPRLSRLGHSHATRQSRSCPDSLPGTGESCGSTTCIRRSTTRPSARRCCRPSSRRISCG